MSERPGAIHARRQVRRVLRGSAARAAVALAALCGTALAQPAGSADDPVVATGDPPLRQSDVVVWQRLVEFAFDATLSEEQKELLGERLTARWQEADQRGRAELLGAKDVWGEASRAVAPEREVMRLQLREGMVKEAEADADEPANRLVLTLRDAASPVLVPGDLPLRKASAEALISLFEWLSSQALGEEFELTEAERDDILLQLARQYPRSAPGDRMLLAHTEELYRWLQLEWDRAGPEARGHFRANLADLLGLPRPVLPAPFVGELDTFEHPDGLLTIPFPADWSMRYSALAEGMRIGGWELLDVAALGGAPAAALQLEALPEGGVLVSAGVLPPEVREGTMSLQEAAFALGTAFLGAFGEPEPLAESIAGERAALIAWTQHAEGVEYAAWVAAIRLPEPEGGAVAIIARAAAARVEEYAPAFARIIYGLQLGEAASPEEQGFSDLAGFPEPRDVTLDLFSMPLRGQMDLLEGLTSGIK